MKTIVVYYSLEGHSKFVAEEIAKNIGADTLGLEPVKPYPTGKVSKFFWGGMSAVRKERRALKPYEFNAKDYDQVIIGTPVWASSFAPPLRTFFSENDLSQKKIALYACSASGNAKKCFDKLREELSGCQIVQTVSIMDPQRNQSQEELHKIKVFCTRLV